MLSKLREWIKPDNSKVDGFEIGDFIVARPDWGEPYAGHITLMVKYPEQIFIRQPNNRMMIVDTSHFVVKVLTSEEEIAYAMLRY